MTAIDLLRWLGETSLALSILILLVLIIRKPFAKAFGARAAYALWLAPAARLFLPELKLLPAPDAAAPTQAPVAADMVAATYEWGAAVIPVPSNAAILTQGVDWLALAASAALFLWAAIAFAWFCFKLETQGEFMRAQLAASKPATSAVVAMANKIAKEFRLARPPQIRINDNDDNGPCLVGLFRPVIFLPAKFATSYADAEQRLVLAHEIAHMARGDMAATLAALFLQAVQWPNPLAHYSFAAFRTDQEAACDAFVLSRCRGSEGNYASAILKSVRKEATAPQYGLALAHPVKERIMLLKSQKKSPLRLAAGVVAAAAFTAVSLAATASYGFVDHETEVKTQKKQSRRITITIDKGETMEVAGYSGATKVDMMEKDGVRTLKVYGKGGKLLSETTYESGEEMPFDEVTTIDKSGERRTVKLSGDTRRVSLVSPVAPLPPGAHRVMVLKGDGDVSDIDFDSVVDFDTVVDFETIDGDHNLRFAKVIADSDSEGHRFHMSDCVSPDGDDEAIVMSWSSQDDHKDGKVVSHKVICLANQDADPEIRAEALRSAIDRIEENGKREAEQRKEMLKNLREQLKEAEKQAK